MSGYVSYVDSVDNDPRDRLDRAGDQVCPPTRLCTAAPDKSTTCTSGHVPASAACTALDDDRNDHNDHNDLVTCMNQPPVPSTRT
jgi:hypothetical protein